MIRKAVRPREGEYGFTLIEILVIIAIMAVLSAVLLLYNRTGERQIILFKEQAKIIGILSRAKSLALQTFNQEGVPCAYGVHFDVLAGKFSIFKDVADDCRDADGRFTDGALDAILEEFALDPNVTFGEETNLTDVSFVPPAPKVIITPTGAEAAVVIKTKEGSVKRVKITSGGQITTQ